MVNFRNTFETCKQSFIRAFLICMTVPLTIYKLFVKPHFHYGGILYHQPNNESMSSKLESVQYNAALPTSGAIKGTSRSKLHKELGLKSLKSRRTFKRLCSFHKIISTGLPTNLSNLIPKFAHGYHSLDPPPLFLKGGSKF